MNKEEKSKKVNPYDLNSVKKERSNNVSRPAPKDINPYSLSDISKLMGASIKHS